MHKFIFLAISILLITSCGLFLEKSGMKNYSIKDKLSQDGLNEYQYDFLYMTRLVEKSYPYIEEEFPKEEREIMIQEILSTLSPPNTNEKDFIIEARRFMARFHNQHTNVYLAVGFDKIHPYSVHIYHDKWFLSNLMIGLDSSFIGKQIIRINQTDIKEFEEKLCLFSFSENKINQQYDIRLQRIFDNTYILKSIGVIENIKDDILLTFIDHSTLMVKLINRSKDIKYYHQNRKLHPITKYQNVTYGYQLYANQDFAYLQYNRCHDKIDILDGIKSYVKPWLQPIARAYVKRQFQKEIPSKQIRGYYNPKYPIFQDFIREIVDSLNQIVVNNLIIDLRHNPGGSMVISKQLVYFLTNEPVRDFTQYYYTSDIWKAYFSEEDLKFSSRFPEGIPTNQMIKSKESDDLFEEIKDSSSRYYIDSDRPIFKGNVYVLANYRTGSAAAMLTTLLQDNGLATIIGTSVGNNATGPTSYTPMKLPNTKTKISIATTYQKRPDTTQEVIQIPDYWVEYSLEDIKLNKDPLFDKAMELIKRH